MFSLVDDTEVQVSALPANMVGSWTPAPAISGLTVHVADDPSGRHH